MIADKIPTSLMKIYEILIPLLSNTKILVTQAFLYLFTLLLFLIIL